MVYIRISNLLIALPSRSVLFYKYTGYIRAWCVLICLRTSNRKQHHTYVYCCIEIPKYRTIEAAEYRNNELLHIKVSRHKHDVYRNSNILCVSTSNKSDTDFEPQHASQHRIISHILHKDTVFRQRNRSTDIQIWTHIGTQISSTYRLSAY